MKRLFVGWALFLALLFGANVVRAEAQAGQRIAWVNSDRLFAEAPGTAEAKTIIDAQLAQSRTELEGLSTALQTLQENLTRQEATLTAVVRQQRAAEINEKMVQYQTRQQELETELSTRQNELSQPIFQKIALIVDNLRAEGNYAIIFDTANGPFLAADPALDLTEQVIQRLHSAAGASAPASTPAAGTTVPPPAAPAN